MNGEVFEEGTSEWNGPDVDREWWNGPSTLCGRVLYATSSPPLCLTNRKLPDVLVFLLQVDVLYSLFNNLNRKGLFLHEETLSVTILLLKNIILLM